MAVSLNRINLIRTKTSSSPQLELVEESLRKTSMIGLVVFVVVGILTGSLYVLFSLERSNLLNTQNQLQRQITEAKNKEFTLVSIKDRTRIVDRTMANQKPWAQVLDFLPTVAVAPQLLSISVDEQGKATVGIQMRSMDEILAAVNGFITLANDSHIRNPQLLSMQFDKDGSIHISVSFFPIFSTL